MQQEQQAGDEEHAGDDPDDGALASLRALAAISAFASSISSRTSSEARSDTCVTASARVVGVGSSAGKALEEEGEDEAAGEGGADGELRSLVGGGGVDGAARRCRRGRRPRRRARPARPSAGRRRPVRRRRSFGRLLAECAHPDHRREPLRGDAGDRADPGQQAGPHSRFTRSLSAISSRIQSALPAAGRDRSARSSPPQIVSTMWVLACSYSRSPVGSNAKIQPVSTCSTAP